jgi:thioredoxin 2
MIKEKRRVVCPNCDSINAVPADRPLHAAICGRCRAKLFQGTPVELNAARLQKHIAKSDLPVIVDFWAPWCGPCRSMAPIFAEAAKSLEPRARFAKINVDENPEAARQYRVQGIPALFAFTGGEVAARQSGLSDPNLLRAWVEQLSS